ncbi:antitoxin Xre/MbcA/ParS toxin-binding domain-containing protein [Pseudomonas putida]
MNCWTSAHALFLTRRQRVLVKATEVLGSADIARHWLIRPAIGLANRPPCALLENSRGYTYVCDFLCRLEYGVYT